MLSEDSLLLLNDTCPRPKSLNFREDTKRQLMENMLENRRIIPFGSGRQVSAVPAEVNAPAGRVT